ncbi:3-deoxy-manno-octulosonate cytidylyltransferase [Lichenifustis flavocetrariae]|uniref:3-deoxy-manno-octulosonate cytidylyltransferase n=1 Tax=Lichenifustis flavocetrariae TaxID=2949735 RepID=A0AA41Z163_9HYPH|nr:3-deoxy-manno-octulosonate cytidylyltransferase [Lichenifustis flavocetrariae]MCW6507377.1 3-deoxy-manno-octulosonate cytidylyltransferase [Lichenifustis flavocetrariae]
MPKPIVLVPARMASTRLPDKPLAMIHGVPMIVHVWRRAMEADIGPVVVAVDDDRVASVITAAGGRAIMTRSDHPSGTDRIFEAVERVDPDRSHDVVVNLQGDLPTVEAAAVRAALDPLADPAVDLATLAATILRPAERTDPNIVKVVGTEVGPGRLRALYFSRSAVPWGDGPLLHHIGLYAYRRDCLRRFVALPPSRLELRERLEQLRALEAGMRIDVECVSAVPFGVDTPDDLERATELLRPRP